MPDDPAARAEWFLNLAMGDAVPVERLLTVLGELARTGAMAEADELSTLLEECLLERSHAEGVYRVLRQRAEWHPQDPDLRAHCVNRLQRLYRNDALQGKFISAAGFEGTLPLPECFRRLDLLRNATQGALCLDRTWGFGVVRRVDAFYGKIAIDFEKRRNHELSFAYAAEALELLAEDHLLAVRHRDPVSLATLCRTAPAEVVKLALRSYGPLTAARLQEVLTATVLRPEEWKVFWDAARRKLQDDPQVLFPAKRSEPLRLLERPRVYDQAWFVELSRARTPTELFARLDELAAAGRDSARLDAAARQVIGERLLFVARGPGEKDPAVLAKAWMAARRWGVAAEATDWQTAKEALFDARMFLPAVTGLGTREAGRLLELLWTEAPERTRDLLLGTMPLLPFALLNTALERLVSGGEEAAAASAMREAVGRRVASVEMLLWLARRPEILSRWCGVTLGDLAFLALAALEGEYSGERLRAARQLAELLEQREWLGAASRSMSLAQRMSFLDLLHRGLGRLAVDAQSMIGRLVSLHPELAASTRTEPLAVAPATALGGITSWRSYHQRQRQLERLLNEEIPRNSRDIAHARSYGDLSENFEYKTALEQQRLLMRRRQELEEQLRTVKGTDFAKCDMEQVAPGTRVVLAYPDGHQQEYCILGEWDQDEALGIVPCGSRLSQSLQGHRVGEEVRVPTDRGEVACRIVAILPLPEAVRAWCRGADD